MFAAAQLPAGGEDLEVEPPMRNKYEQTTRRAARRCAIYQALEVALSSRRVWQGGGGVAAAAAAAS